MNCKRARMLILTDYIDDQADAKAKNLIEEHMAKCSDCKNLYLSAKRTTNELFLNTASCANPPEYVWRRVKTAIIAEEDNKRKLPVGIFDKLRNLIYISRPVLAIATVMVLLVIVGTAAKITMNNMGSSRALRETQAEYLDYLAGTSVDNMAAGNAGYGTTIEKYFL